MNDALTALRARIDEIDDAILKLVSERAGIAQQVGRAKNGEKIYRPEREAQIVQRLRDANPGPLSGDSIERLIREIMSACRALEQTTRVAYLGPAGTFSQQAVLKQFGQEVEALAESDIDACFEAVETGRADFAVVPVENSTEGAIGRTLDLVVSSPLRICGEVVLPIHQTLMRKTGSPAGDGLAGIARVYGHAQSLAQCQHWISRHLPMATRVSVVSNSEGARLAAADVAAAALGAEAAAGLYGLTVIESRIEDEASNTTRFLVMGASDAPPSGRDKTSLVMGAKNQPGAVLKLLQPLADAGISMSRLESRPARRDHAGRDNWEYLFFVVCDGHRQDARLAAALAEIDARAAFLKVLGSYPAASA
jgi:chorismate mutase/prephenate dehydratase